MTLAHRIREKERADPQGHDAGHAQQRDAKDLRDFQRGTEPHLSRVVESLSPCANANTPSISSTTTHSPTQPFQLSSPAPPQFGLQLTTVPIAH